MAMIQLKDHPMQVILQPVLPSEGDSVAVETNAKAILSSLVSSYCTHKGIKFSGNYAIYDDRKRPLPLYSTISSIGIENGQTLLIGKEDSSFSVFKQWPIVVAFAALAIGLIGILTMSLVYGLKGGEYFDDYGVVMDAGSSKTNTIVYKWRSSKFKGTGKVSQEDNCYAKGGIAKMDPMHLEPVIECAKNVTSVIAESSLKKTPLFFAATAGMRLLELTNPSRVNAILDQLRLKLPETELNVQNIEIISGRDEGIYGWVTSNFLKTTLEKEQKSDPWVPTTYGALDMGGASMQISYAIKPDTKESENVTDIQLYGQTYKVFSQSNLCFGRDEANNRYLVLLLLDKKNNSNDVEDPCVPKGENVTRTSAQLFEPICAQFPNKESKYQNKTFNYVGTSDAAACRKKVSQLLDNDLCNSLKFKECFKKHSTLPNNQKFLAFATYYYTTNFLNIKNVTLDEYKDTMTNFCLKNLSEVDKLNNTYGTQYCFNAQYIYEVLINGFGFTSNTWENVEFIGKIAGKDVGWTLGYMINATNIIPVKATPRLISTVSLTVSLVLFILVIIFTAIFLLFTWKKGTDDSGKSPS